MELPKAYIPADHEPDIQKLWARVNYAAFKPQPKRAGAPRDYFSMVLPPPNVTGTLHMGHATMLAIQDVVARFWRMQGVPTLWVPGTDHAAVATESKVEKLLIKDGMKHPKQELGKDEFLARVRTFAQDSHDTIVTQCRAMGASLDWSREAYTLDEVRSQAVRTVFKSMYDDGLIYRGYRVVNWSVKGQSTCSDDELVYKERPAMLYTFTYGPECPIAIATTRPETKLGDTAIAVHPQGRWKEYIGQVFRIHDFGQAGHTLILKVIGSEQVDDQFGTGALGVTPAHSMTDFEMYEAQRQAGDPIELIQVIGEDGRMKPVAGDAYAGLTTIEAREKLVAWLRATGRLTEEKEVVQSAATSDRFEDVVEPLPKTQWFINVNKNFTLKGDGVRGLKKGEEVTLKHVMRHVVEHAQIRIVPERFEKVYYHWIDNLRDWCISRQIWFGHQIPVWYRGDEIVCALEAPEGEGWVQDPDTLDTWFSSGLWSFSTLMGEGDTIEIRDGALHINSDFVKQYHPTSLLETGRDIIFFWVARMILMTTYALGEIPFETVYLHGLVNDAQGRKMSKSLGNIIDPLDMIKEYGTDATRLSLIVGTTPGNDVSLSVEKIAGFRNFANKLWNIARFIQMQAGELSPDVERPDPVTDADAWVLGQLDEQVLAVAQRIEKYDLSNAAQGLQEFTWGQLADWYLEIAKIEKNKALILNYTLNTILKLWHPFMPFVTETIWKTLYPDTGILMLGEYPRARKSVSPADIKREELFARFAIGVVSQIRSQRATAKIPPAHFIPLQIESGNPDAQRVYEHIVKGLARVSEIEYVLNSSFEDGVFYIRITKIEASDEDTQREKERCAKVRSELYKAISSLEAQLNNQEFVAKAPEKIVSDKRAQLQDYKKQLEALEIV